MDPAMPAPHAARMPRERDGVIETDLCILGAGSGGLSVAAGAAQMGASVVLIEKARMGGDCLNSGCVPSKALIAAAHAAHVAGHSGAFGVRAARPEIDFAAVHRHIHDVIGAIAPHDSVERFEGLGVRVISGEGRFLSREMVGVDSHRIRARRFVIATGSRAAVPPIPGLAESGYLTNETLFDLTALPAHLIVLGGGPIGVEMAQAFRRLGAMVTLVEAETILAKDEPEAVAVVRRRLVAEGIDLREGSAVTTVQRAGDTVHVTIDGRDGAARITGTHLLVAAGRHPVVEGLALDRAGITATPRGVVVDARLRTSNRRVFAIGDVVGGPQFTHVAGYHAGIVIRNALFGLPATVDLSALPWVTYCDPELAHVGLTEAEARKSGGVVEVLEWPFSGNDRAQAERATEGLAKIVLGRKGRILGATIVGPRAGDLIGLWALAMSSGRRIGDIAATILPYPTVSEISKRAAGSHYTPRLFGTTTRRIVGLIQRFLP